MSHFEQFESDVSRTITRDGLMNLVSEIEPNKISWTNSAGYAYSDMPEINEFIITKMKWSEECFLVEISRDNLKAVIFHKAKNSAYFWNEEN